MDSLTRTSSKGSESRLMAGFLNAIERAGNRLPEPALIFLYFMLLVMGFPLRFRWWSFLSSTR